LTDSDTDEVFVKRFFAIPWNNNNNTLLNAHEPFIAEHEMTEDHSVLVKSTNSYVNHDLRFIWISRSCYSDPILDPTILDMTIVLILDDDSAIMTSVRRSTRNRTSEEKRVEKHSSSEELPKVIKKRHYNKGKNSD